MSVHICSSQGSDIVVVDSPGIQLTYTMNALGHLSRTIIGQQHSAPKVTYSVDQTKYPLVLQVTQLIAKCAQNIHKISKRFGFTIEGTGFDCCRNFTVLIQERRLDAFDKLDLSNLGIDTVPFHIGLFRKVRHIDLSNNELRVLPPELGLLPYLEVINLRGNPIVELPSWLKSHPTLKILMDEVAIDTDQLAQFDEQ